MPRRLGEVVAEQFRSGTTWLEWVWWMGRTVGLDLSDQEIDFILWERTAWPVADGDYVQRQVAEYLQDRGNHAELRAFDTQRSDRERDI